MDLVNQPRAGLGVRNLEEAAQTELIRGVRGPSWLSWLTKLKRQLEKDRNELGEETKSGTDTVGVRFGCGTIPESMCYDELGQVQGEVLEKSRNGLEPDVRREVEGINGGRLEQVCGQCGGHHVDIHTGNALRTRTCCRARFEIWRFGSDAPEVRLHVTSLPLPRFPVDLPRLCLYGFQLSKAYL